MTCLPEGDAAPLLPDLGTSPLAPSADPRASERLWLHHSCCLFSNGLVSSLYQKKWHIDFSLHKLVSLTIAQFRAPAFVYLRSDREAGCVGVCGLQGIAVWFLFYLKKVGGEEKVPFLMFDRAEFP